MVFINNEFYQSWLCQIAFAVIRLDGFGSRVKYRRNLPNKLISFHVLSLQKFELKRNPFLIHLMGNLPQEELEKSNLAAKLNSYAAELCPPRIQKQIDAKIKDIIRKGWPILRDE
ncbi:hypothetical protein WN944_020942 [Citrus x changshan-huyou]|uniref:Uncharacterized protein n=1 Tax=Citrus x changshan-huyou TaxID=2935761 RepID=A0AAP0MYB7_9ROSI